MAGQGGSILRAGPRAVTDHRRQVQQHRESRGAFDQGADRRTVQADDQVALPVAGDSTVGNLRRTLADHQLGRDELLAPLPGSGAWYPQRAASTQARAQVSSQCATTLNV